ncbi:MAG: AAA family ATPase [Acidobacteriota bacterium]|nr:AAA family ATPase [Acidobacteriota bacterium]
MTQQLNQDSALLREITLRNILSYGLESSPISLGSLNVLIGPNGSGKSNLIDAIGLLRFVPLDSLRSVISREGGGVLEWIWKGNPKGEATIDAVFAKSAKTSPMRHAITFRAENQTFNLTRELIEEIELSPANNARPSFYRLENGDSVVKQGGQQKALSRGSLEADKSILAQRRDPENYPEISYVASVYERIRVYREWTFGRNSVFRAPQKADARNDRLEEDFSNLGLFLNRLRRDPKAKKAILAALADLYEGLSDFDVSVEGGTVQVFFTEGDFTIPATRLSDGTLRYLCLLAILCDPTPPPLICIEEPELGLHPDILPKIADLLIAASERTQLIVTTHSDILVDAMTERPESILICEKHEGQTEMRRLDSQKLAVWLEDYRLGELWTRGELGGTRW